MADYSKKRVNRTYVALRLSATVAGVVFLGFFAVVSGRAAWGMYGKFAEARAESAVAQAELAALKEKEGRVEASVDDFSSARGFEKEVRTRFGVAREGEGEIKIVRDEPDAAAVVVEPEGLWARLFKALRFW
jgi:cell division protein FtsB